MDLKTLKIHNFKGIRSFDFNPNGKNADIFGTNETGKTTIMDAFLWLLTDKDSQNSAQFSIKPINGLKKGAFVEVEGVFDLDGKRLALKKVYSEIWRKKRGSATKEFSGHTTDFFVDEVPVKLKGFQEKISEIADPDTVRMLTNTRYVNEEMKWEDRRRLLIEVCGDVADEDVVKENPKFKGILETIGDKSTSDYITMLQYNRKALNKELSSIPVRIDELLKSLPDITVDVADLEKEKAVVVAQISDLRKQVSAIEAGSGAELKKRELLAVENKIQEMEQARNKANAEGVDHQRTIVRAAEEDVSDAERTVTAILRKMEEAESKNKRDEDAAEKLRKQWFEENAKQFEGSEVCPTCGQDLPADQVQAAVEKFNTEKANALEEIDTKGKAIVSVMEARAKDLKKLGGAHKADVGHLEYVKKAYEEAKAELEKVSATTEDPSPEYKKLVNERDALLLSGLENAGNTDTSALQSEIEGLEKQKNDIVESLASIKSEEGSRKRIKELEAQEKKLSAEIETVENDMQLVENFIRAKCDMLTERINSKFEITDFLLFEEQINGGLKDVCTATVKGVPYSDLNNAARIRCGMDIINALSDFYGVRMPLFCDNAESVVELLPTESQLIRLIVSEKDTSLRVVVLEEA